jgi:hypothetical protein
VAAAPVLMPCFSSHHKPMPDAEIGNNVFTYLDKIGTAGLAFMLWMLLSGRLITKREFDAVVSEKNRLSGLVDIVLNINERALVARDKMKDNRSTEG